MIRPLLLSSLLLMSSLACSTGLNSGDNVLKFRATDNPTTTRAPKCGDYVVAFRQKGSDELWQAHDTRRTVRKGDELGFTRDDNNNVVAIAGRSEKSIGQFPLIAQYACWYRLPDDYDANRKLRKDLRLPGEVTAGATAAVAAPVGAAAADGLESAVRRSDPTDASAIPKQIRRETNHHPTPADLPAQK